MSVPKIMTEFGPVTESMRLQAAINMRVNEAKRHEVEEFLAKKLGSAAKGLAEAQRLYPEAYAEDNQ